MLTVRSRPAGRPEPWEKAERRRLAFHAGRGNCATSCCTIARRGRQRVLARAWFIPPRVGPGRVWTLWLLDDPHACGAMPGPRVVADGQRITATRVGLGVPFSITDLDPADHPHACGAWARGRRSRLSLGSPPRVWGRVDQQPTAQNEMRITPTRVGLGGLGSSLAFPGADHPHACGAGPRARLMASCQFGSPPRVWGREESCAVGDSFRRITPTRVGPGSSPTGAPMITTDHPHACGAGP